VASKWFRQPNFGPLHPEGIELERNLQTLNLTVGSFTRHFDYHCNFVVGLCQITRAFSFWPIGFFAKLSRR